LKWKQALKGQLEVYKELARNGFKRGVMCFSAEYNFR